MIAIFMRGPSPDTAFRTVAEPAEHVVVGSASASHHIPTTDPQPRRVAEEIDDGEERALLAESAIAKNLGVPGEDRPPVASPSHRQLVLRDHPPAVGDREAVDAGR